MNPFLQPTVATPQTDARWPGRAGRDTPAGSHAARHAPADIKEARQPVSSGRVPRALPARPDRGLRKTVRALMALAVTGFLLAPAMATAVDVNSATAQQLQEIKGIGPKMAGVIIEERTRGGRFESFDDISERVKGIGPKKVASLQSSGLTVGGGPAATAAAAAGAAAKGGAAAGAKRRR